MSENRCKRCDRRLSDTTARYGEKCAKILGYRNPEKDKSGRVADVQHATHEKITELENYGIDWRNGVGEEMLFDMVRAEYLRILNEYSNLQTLSQPIHTPPKDPLAAHREEIYGAMPKAKEKAALLAERMPEWYQMNMEYSKKKVGSGDKNFEDMGCGALAMAMIIKALTGLTVSPLELAKYAVENDHYIHNVGIAPSFFSPVAADYGLCISEIIHKTVTTKDELIAALRSGNPVIAHMGPGAFTEEGHYMVLVGVSDDGKKILVYDGGHRSRFNKYYDTDLIFNETKGNFRVLTYDGKYQDDGLTFKKK